MKPSLIHKIFSFTVIAKSVSYKNGVFALMSVPISIGFVDIFKNLFKDVTMHNLIIPIVSIVTCILLYILFWIVDFFTGLSASKFQQNNNPQWVQSDKLYNTFAKFVGILLINVLFLVILLFLSAISFQGIATGFLIISVAINILTILFEFQSIGENIHTKTGKKPQIFTFFDRLTEVMETLILDKFKKWFGGSEPNTDNLEK